MLLTVDRIQIATPDAAEAAQGWQSLLGAREVGEDRLACLGARRTTCRLGTSEIEFLEPDGPGAVDDALKKRGRGHLFAAGASTDDPVALKGHFDKENVEYEEEAGQIHALAKDLNGGDFRFVLSPAAEREPAGDIDFIYEATMLGPDSAKMEAEIARIFDLDRDCFCSIESKTFGYNGVLTLFHKDRLHRFEAITPWTTETTMGRFLDRQGPAYYMAFAETASMRVVEERALESGAPITVDRPDGRADDQTPDQMWVHPPVLGGVMLGLSRPTMAWRWSGHPERVEEVSA